MVSKIKSLSNKEAAFLYAEMGFTVFPVYGIDAQSGKCLCGDAMCRNKGKHPATGGGGFKKATTDLNQINVWWNNEPRSNIGISAIGSGLIVVDVDPRNKGFETLAALEDEHGKLPETLSANTSIQGGKKGNHHYFRAPEGKYSLKGTIGEGIDIKYSGYVVAPPSIHQSGIQYEWVAGCYEIADLPDWVFKLARTSDKIKVSDLKPCGTTTHGTFTDVYDLRVVDWLMPHDAVQHGDTISGSHPVHGSTTGSNLSINTKDNTWYCFRCQAGGSGGDAYAVNRGIIECEDAGKGAFDDPETACMMIESLKSDGYTIKDELLEEGAIISESFLKTHLINKADPPKPKKKVVADFWRLPGIGGDLQDIYMKTAPVPNLKYAWVAALAVISVVCSRKYTSVRRNYTSLYFIVLGDSSTGKTFISAFVSKVLSQCGMSKLWSGDGGFATEQGAFSALKKSPSLATTIDEAGLTRKAGKDNAFQVAAKAAAMKIFSQCDGEFGLPKVSMRSRAKRERDDLEEYNKPVKKPGLTCVEMSTVDTFMETLKTTNAESGELGRYLIILSTEFPYPNQDDILEDVVVPDTIRSALRNLRYGNHAHISDDKIREIAEKQVWDEYNNRDVTDVDIGELISPSDAAITIKYEQLKSDKRWIMGYPDDPDTPPETIKYQWEYPGMYKELFEKEHIKILKEYRGKTAVHTKAMETAAKLALVYSIMSGYEYISKRCALKSIEVMRTLIKQVDDDILPEIADTEQVRLVQKICKIIEQAGTNGASVSDWRNLRLWRNTSSKIERENVIGMLNDYGILQGRRDAELGGKGNIVYFHPDFFDNDA